MNLIEAVKSGRPYRRIAHRECAGWKYPLVNETKPECRPVESIYSYCRDDILADDWEILPASVTITSTQFWEAVEQVNVTVRDTIGYKEVNLREYLMWPITKDGPLMELARKLGFT